MAPVDYSKWKTIEDDEDLSATKPAYSPDAEAEALIQSTYASEMAQEQQINRLNELKIKLAVDAYEKRRPLDKLMHHYWIKEAGDPEVIGEYIPSGNPSDMMHGAPIYRNQHGMRLHRDRAPTGPNTHEESFVWVIGHLEERRILYLARTDDLSAPTLRWEARTAPEPVPVIRYYTETSAARVFKERGNAAFHKKDWAEAEGFYTQALDCKMDATDCAEPLGILYSNRAEARLQLFKFSGASEDAEKAHEYLQTLATQEATKQTKLKTVVRLAKARKALKRFSEALSVLQAEKRNFPDNQEIDRLIEEIKIAQGLSTQPPGKGGATAGMLKFLSDTLSTLGEEIDGLGGKLSDPALPSSCATSLKKLEYVLFRAKAVQGDCLSDLQRVMRTCDGLRMLEQVILAQWKANLDGKMVDTFQLPAAASVAVIAGLCCISCPENSKVVSSTAHCYFSLLGGCNQKVDKDTCEVLISFAFCLMEYSKVKTVELIQAHSIVVQHAANFLSKASLADPSDDGVDSPLLATEAKDQAAALLKELFAVGGRVEKRALRGAVQHLAGPEGYGFFTAETASVRALGECVVDKIKADPSLMSPVEVKNFLIGADLLIRAYEEEVGVFAVESYEELGPDAKLRYIDLGGFESKEDGRYCTFLLQAVSKALEFRLLRRDGELEKDNFESAFHQGSGYSVLVPLLQGPVAFAEPALLCLATLAQTSNVNTIAGLPVFDILIGKPYPVDKPMADLLDTTLKESAAARKTAAKLLTKTVETPQAKNSPPLSSKRLVNLLRQTYQDGLSSIEAFNDVLNVLLVILETRRPDPLFKLMSEADDMLGALVDCANRVDETEVTTHARSIYKALRKDPGCKRKLKLISERAEGLRVYEPGEEDLLQASSGPWFHHL